MGKNKKSYRRRKVSEPLVQYDVTFHPPSNNPTGSHAVDSNLAPSWPNTSGMGEATASSTSTNNSTAPLSSAVKTPHFKLRKSIQPQTAYHILAELLGEKKPSWIFHEVPSVEAERRAIHRNVTIEEVGVFDCICEIDGELYLGDGYNLAEARNAAAEEAFKAQVTELCQLNDPESKTSPSEDNCPWQALASLALRKMYDSWRKKGYDLPQELVTLPKSSVTDNPFPSTDFTGKKTPLQLVNEMISQSGLNSEITLSKASDAFCALISIGGQWQYIGNSTSKKSAKEEAAKGAIKDSESWYRPRKRKYLK